MHLVRKKDGTWRFTVDYRKLNSMTIPDAYPLPNIEEMMDNLKGVQFVSKLDLVDGFWHIVLVETDREKTGFATKRGFWRWKVLPMGLMNSPGTFQKAMDEILAEYRWKFCLVFIDDILIFSRTFKEHLEHLRLVLAKLREHGLFAKLKKCKFLMSEMLFLGHVISKEGIRPDPSKVEALDKKDSVAVRRFLGMAGYYRKFIKNFARRTEHLRRLTRKDVTFVWTKQHRMEFNDIKKALVNHPVMAYPDFTKPFILTVPPPTRVGGTHNTG